MKTIKATKWTVEVTTGNTLVDATGRGTGPESTGRVLSTHRTEAAAERAADKARNVSSTPVVVFAR
jgi:hypothetical protein